MSGNTPKTMSKGLMGMKFMQRAAAKSSPSSPSTPNGPPTKKARLSNGASAVGTSDQQILQSGLDAEEEKRQAALEKAAQHAGETKWVLSFKDPVEGKRQDAMTVRQAGYAEIDAEDSSEEEEEEVKPIRMQFGGGVKKADTSVPFVKTEDSESEAESSSSDYDSDDPAADLIRQTKREMASEKRESKKKRASMGNGTPKGTPTRQDEDRNLKGLTSISGSRRSGAGGNMSNVECYKCGQKGHMAAGCSESSTPRGSSGRGKGKNRR
ncbi:zinc knuckle protein [Stemphylium lycopersici]|uniref:Zinc knuckle protein n=1 Tax=Stemphylium lycopersici TaxID=183478 RepID=A0A364NGC8_STELY|nr:zinc knuckle protein [Stemphylium lycopersici]RAR03680.1 zinc knuckle protein [Stemphylium lycopersici]RAR16151.1 zinc knuckle protein [Stemphylium lycopersici]